MGAGCGVSQCSSKTGKGDWVKMVVRRAIKEDG